MKKHLALAKHHAANILTSSITGPNKKANKKLRAEHYLENVNHFMCSLLLAGLVGVYTFIGTQSIILTADAASLTREANLRAQARMSRTLPRIVSGEKRVVENTARSQTGALNSSGTGSRLDERTFTSAPAKTPTKTPTKTPVKRVPVKKVPVKKVLQKKTVVSGEQK